MRGTSRPFIYGVFCADAALGACIYPRLLRSCVRYLGPALRRGPSRATGQGATLSTGTPLQRPSPRLMAPIFQRWPQILMAGPNPARGMAPDGRVLLATSIYHLTNDAAVTVMAGQITVLQRELVFGYVDTGLLTAVALLVTVIAQIAFGHNADRRDPARFLAFGIAFLGLAPPALTTAASFLPFLGLVALSPIG